MVQPPPRRAYRQDVPEPPGRLRATVEAELWPLVESFLDLHDTAGLAVAVVREGERVCRGFGVRDLRTGAPVTPDTMFHLASVSKPFVATAVVSLAMTSSGGERDLDLDAPITDWVPELVLADGREGDVTARGLLSHSSGLPDVVEYGWHDPQLGDDALAEFARSLAGSRLRSEPGAEFAYCNAGFELLGLASARVLGTTFEDAVHRQVLAPLGMSASTFLRGEVPEDLAALPHLGMPLSVLDDAYPYTRRHAPSSTLHSNLTEMCRWMVAHLEPSEQAAVGVPGRSVPLHRGLLDVMWRPAVQVGRPPWLDAAALGWALGSYRGHRVLSHSGMDPGFQAHLALLPDRRTGVVVLSNSNTVPTTLVAAAALDVALADLPAASGPAESTGFPRGAIAAMRSRSRSVAGPVATALATSGPDAAAAEFRRLAAQEPPRFDLDDEGFVDAVWGAVELHRTGAVRPLVRLWTELRPGSSAAWTMAGWAEHVDGRSDLARHHLRRALDLDPENDEAATIMGVLPER